MCLDDAGALIGGARQRHSQAVENESSGQTDNFGWNRVKSRFGYVTGNFLSQTHRYSSNLIDRQRNFFRTVRRSSVP
jgi:hypothetical protein